MCEKYSHLYVVVLVKDAKEFLVQIHNYDACASVELETYSKDGREIYSIKSDHDLEQLLDRNDQVSTYIHSRISFCETDEQQTWCLYSDANASETDDYELYNYEDAMQSGIDYLIEYYNLV